PGQDSGGMRAAFSPPSVVGEKTSPAVRGHLRTPDGRPVLPTPHGGGSCPLSAGATKGSATTADHRSMLTLGPRGETPPAQRRRGRAASAAPLWTRVATRRAPS